MFCTKVLKKLEIKYYLPDFGCRRLILSYFLANPKNQNRKCGLGHTQASVIKFLALR